MSNFNMPYQQDKESMDGGKGSWSLDFYRPLPDKAKQTNRNQVIIPLFSPNNWALFNPTVEDAQKYGIAGGGGLVSLDANNPLQTFYLRIAVHQVRKFHHKDGKVGHANVICPIEFNRYLTETLGKQPLYDMPRCAFCEEASQMWDSHNERWDSIGVDKKGLSNEGYWDQIKRDPILSATHRTAKELGTTDRCIVSVFDHDKFTGVRKLDDGEEGVHHQIWYAPKSVYTELWNLYEMTPGGFPFFEPTPQGWPIITVTKDTSECEGNNLRNTKYSVSYMGKMHLYPQEWTDYIRNQQSQVDPTQYLHQLSYEEGRFYISQLRESANVPQGQQTQVPQEYNTAPAFSGAQLPPGAPPMGASGSLPQQQGAPPAPQGAPPAQPAGTAAMAPPPPGSPPPGAQIGTPIPGSPPPPGTPPAAQPPAPAGSPPPGAPPQQQLPAQTAPAQPQAPIPQQPPAVQPQPPIPTAPGFQQPAHAQPPDRSAPPGGDQPPGAKRRKW